MNRARAVRWLPAVLALGCAAHPPLPPELAGPEVADRLLVSPRAGRELEQFAERPVLPAPPPTQESAEPQVFTLPDAVAFAMRNSPRLREAKAGIDRARGEEMVAFAPFLPEVDFAYRFVDFSNPVQVTSQQIPAVIGFGAGSRDFSQGELQLQWTLYDFGRTSGKYGRAVSREHVAALQAGRAEQTVAYDVVAAYLRVLLAGATKRVQVQAVKRAEAILADSRAKRKGGVAERDDVLRAEVQVSEAREFLVGAEQEEYDALARLNFTMGRNVSLPLTLVDWTDRPAFDRPLTDCLEVALEQRRELAAAREAAAAAVQGLSAVKAEFLPRLYVKGVAARIDGTRHLPRPFRHWERNDG